MRYNLALLCILLGTFSAPSPGSSQWVKTNGPGSGGILSLAVNGKYLFAGTFFGAGISRTSDSGATWSAANTGLDGSIGSTVVHTIFCEHIVLSGAIKLFAGTGDGIYSSTNDGSNWKHVSSGLPSGAQVTSFAQSGTNLFAGTSAGVLLSTNDGSAWRAVNNGLTNTNVECLAVSGSSLFAGTDGGVFLSTNNGSTWSASSNGLTDTTLRALAVIGTTLFAGTYAWPDTGSVFRSVDNGASWTKVSTGLQPAEIKCLAVSGTNLFAGIDSGAYLTTNNGASWSSVSTGLTGLAGGYAVAALAINGNTIYAGTDTVWRRPLSEMIALSGVKTPRTAPAAASVYPNPFKESTTIAFTTETSAYAEITLVNCLGIEVARIFTGVLEAGEHAFPLSLAKDVITPGIYECVLRRNDTLEAFPLIRQR